MNSERAARRATNIATKFEENEAGSVDISIDAADAAGVKAELERLGYKVSMTGRIKPGETQAYRYVLTVTRESRKQ